MTSGTLWRKLERRTVIKAAAATAVAQFAGPFVVTARAADEIKFGLDDPLTGTYAELGKNEQIGCQLAIDQINAKGGILGRKAELLVEDSTSADTGIAVQKARKLIERDKVDFFLGNVNSAMAIALGEVSNELKKLHIVTGGHTDSVTGSDCHWNVFRVCNTTRMETNSVSKTLFNKYGKKWYFITPDYAFGHTLQEGFEASLKQFGGTEVGASLTPLGATDFSSYLIQAQAANPDVIIFLTAGQDMVNALKQAVQFGLDKRFHIAGAQQELEVLEGLPPEARIGTWVFEWYWVQPKVPHVTGVRRRYQKDQRRQSADGAPLVRLCRDLDLRARRQRAKDPRPDQARQGARKFQAAAGDRVDAVRHLLSRRRSPADADALRRQCGREGPGAGGSVQGRRTGEGRRRRIAGRRDRLPSEMAGVRRLIPSLAEAVSPSPTRALCAGSPLSRSAGEGAERSEAGEGRRRSIIPMTQLLLFNLFNGLIIGAFYALMALGLSLILNLSGVINFAHGGFLAIGAYLAYMLIPHIGFWGALAVAPVLTAGLGLVVERVLIRPLYGRDPLYSLLLTFGLAFILEDGTRYIWGPATLPFAIPGWLSSPLSNTFFFLTGYRMFMVALVVTAVIGAVPDPQPDPPRHAHPRRDIGPRDGVRPRRQHAHFAQPEFRPRHLSRRPGGGARRRHAGPAADNRQYADHAELCRDHHRRARQPAGHAIGRPA